MNKAKLFRKRMNSKEAVVIAGAHSGLSAKIVETCGFDGVWASSFEISSAYCLPDANLLSFGEIYESVKSINRSTNIPVIVDGDNGYGNATNVIRTVQEYDSIGIAGICIEDNIFPKRCSFYDSKVRTLEDITEFSGKIKAAKDNIQSKDFFVIARTEAFIRGLGLKEALKRATAYEEAGADAILIHSKSSTPSEVKSFAERWKSETPLVVVPTKFPQVSVQELNEMGFKLIIFANHALRASIKSMRDNLTLLNSTGVQTSILENIAPLSEVYKLVNLDKLMENENKYLGGCNEKRRNEK